MAKLVAQTLERKEGMSINDSLFKQRLDREIKLYKESKLGTSKLVDTLEVEKRNTTESDKAPQQAVFTKQLEAKVLPHIIPHKVTPIPVKNIIIQDNINDSQRQIKLERQFSRQTPIIIPKALREPKEDLKGWGGSLENLKYLNNLKN